MLSDDQVNHFFVNVLNLPHWKQLKNTDLKTFLRELLQRYQYYCYFHSVEMTATPQEKRRPPVTEDSIRLGLAGSGGVCFHQNQFMTLILQALGFNVWISAGTCGGSESKAEGNHCMCILKMSEEEMYAIDVGCGQPIDEPIPLHKLPYSGTFAGFRFEYRYNKADKTVEKWQHEGTFFRGPYRDPEKSELRYKFSLTEKDPTYFNQTLVDIFTNYEKSIFLKCPFLFRALDLGSEVIGNPNGRRFALVFGASIVIFDNVNREVTNFPSYKDLFSTITKYFPKLDHEMLIKALTYNTDNCKELVLGRGSE